MNIRIRGLRMGLDSSESDLRKAAAHAIGTSIQNIREIRIERKAIDARRKKVFFMYTVIIEVPDWVLLPNYAQNNINISVVKPETKKDITRGTQRTRFSPLIVGSGPAGLFCALLLARYGYKPVIIEQGLDVDTRVKRVEEFWNTGKLDIMNNTQFGEGGAGSFSDGKLTTRSNDERVTYVLRVLADFGAPEEIIWLKKPHVGTDVIREVVKKVRQEIIRLGGEVWFNAKLTDLNIYQGNLNSVEINHKTIVPISNVVLAIGHSSRPVYRMLHQKGVTMKPKSFAVGVRLEHPQEVIDYMQYGEFAGHPALGPADYSFTYQDRETGRSLYTFCMCPGGRVVAAASDAGQVVVNGMSYAKRDSGIANSAVVVTVKPDDWDDEILGGVDYQEELEEKAFIAGGSNYSAPAQYLVDFLEHEATDEIESDTIATYRPGLTPYDMWKLFPKEISDVMYRGLKSWIKKAPEFLDEQAIMTGIETRTSAPLRIVRNEERVSDNVRHLYPCGEGAGYAGGIVSAAIDGLKTAEKIISTYAIAENRIEINDSDAIRGSNLHLNINTEKCAMNRK